MVEALLPAYAEPLFAPRRYKVLYGGRGAGRSWSVARALVVTAAASPRRILCAREFQKSIKDSVHRLLQDQIALLGLPGYEITDREIRHVNGSLFLFEGLRHNVKKIKSLEGLDVAWVEEAEAVSKASWDVLVPTIRRPGSEIWATFNPDLESDPTYQRFVVTPPPDAFVCQVAGDDNPWFPEVLARERAYLYAVDPDAAAHVWGGACKQVGGAQIMRGKWIVEDFEPDPTWDGPYFGADFGFAQDPNTLVKVWIAPGALPGSSGRLMVEREAWKVGQDTDVIPVDWLTLMPDAARHTVRADSARPETISYLSRHGLPSITGVEKWKGSVEDGIAFLRQFEQIAIHPRCSRMADEARLYSYKIDRLTGDVLPEVVDAHNHLWDSVRYALAPLIQRSGTGVLDYYASRAGQVLAERDAHREDAARG